MRIPILFLYIGHITINYNNSFNRANEDKNDLMFKMDNVNGNLSKHDYIIANQPVTKHMYNTTVISPHNSSARSKVWVT